MRVILAALILWLSAPAQAKWLEARTDNFIVYSDGSEKQLRVMAERLELYDQVLRVMTNTKAKTSPMKMTVYLLDSRATLQSVYGASSTSLAGFYTTTRFGAVAFVPRLKSESAYDIDSELVLYHEYAHHFMLQYYPAAYPTWYVEGFAEYFGATQFRKSEIQVGRIAMHRVPSLALEAWLPMEKLLTLTYHKKDKVSDTEMQQLYAQGWLLTHYLFSSEQRQGQIGQYALHLNKGLPHAEAFQKAFQTDFATLGKELSSYYRDGKLIYRRLTITKLPDTSLTVRALGPEEEALLLPVAKLRMGLAKDKQAEFNTKFNAALTPYAATETGRLAQAEWENRFGDSANVQPLLDPVLIAKPDHAHALAVQAYAAYRLSLKAEGEAKAAAIRAARTWAIKANRAAPETPLPLMLNYLSYRREEKGPTANALIGLEQAWALMPQDSYLSVLTATGVALASRKEDARFYLRSLINNPHGGNGAASAQALMKTIESDGRLGMPLEGDDE
jgi:hypothetical protein